MFEKDSKRTRYHFLYKQCNHSYKGVRLNV
jgi:hypothetical protein